MSELKLILESHWILGLASVISGILLGYLFGGFIVPRLAKSLTNDTLDTEHPLYLALLSFVRFSFLLLGLYTALKIIRLEPETRGTYSLYLKVFTILIFTVSLARVGSGAFTLYSTKTEGLLPSASILNNIVRMLIFATGGLVALQTLGISVTPALTALGVGGLAFALGLQETLSNLFAGLGVLLGKKVSVGDYISLETGEEGLVEDINWRTTSLKKGNGSTIIIPNAKMSKTTYTNFSLPNEGLWTVIEFSVDAETETSQLEKAILDSARQAAEQLYPKNEFGSQSKLVYRSLGPFNIDLAVQISIRDIKDSQQIRSFFIKSLHSRFRSEGIGIVSPETYKIRAKES
ncbi:mechanosensitive ion channel family protein [Leptospira langatensis]|uniref:Mechanosensitive ion channel family protein n=1 Tax=Leptospira langatensis TaxID=2484983 RepID=A0A5F1ZSL5_9LEPT|nr:mechanosensitive ion channel domain-containing protein [Leptospira langatensis]TGJ98803.1 mechanosensitive ion channel family protein [Leptospira langatensis]TGL40630.1 mechanosensitive ion channel family protein [Leptospira langatensis]